MMFSEIMAVCCENHSGHKNTPCVQNEEFFENMGDVPFIVSPAIVALSYRKPLSVEITRYCCHGQEHQERYSL